MKYVIHGEVPPDKGSYLEGNPEAMQELLGAWQAAKPEAMYFSLTRRYFLFVLDAPNEDAFFEPLHQTWMSTGSYPTVEPVATIEEFGKLLHRTAGD